MEEEYEEEDLKCLNRISNPPANRLKKQEEATHQANHTIYQLPTEQKQLFLRIFL